MQRGGWAETNYVMKHLVAWVTLFVGRDGFREASIVRHRMHSLLWEYMHQRSFKAYSPATWEKPL